MLKDIFNSILFLFFYCFFCYGIWTLPFKQFAICILAVLGMMLVKGELVK